VGYAYMHSVETECFDKETSSKPVCNVSECKGLHSEDLHHLSTRETSSVNAMV
jgi:hypothetical protein